jgi:prefoldin subunit 5
METNQCEYAETALEHYMKKCYSLEEENKQLKQQLEKLLKIMEGT